MLLIKTDVRPSTIHGFGLFALQSVGVGEAVWQFTPGFDLDMDPRELDHLPAAQRERLLHYGYIDARTARFILCCDDARFINHSERPNVAPDYANDPHGIDRATREIGVGEEITIDYRIIEVE